MNSTEASQASLGSLTGLKSFETGKQLILRQFPMLIFQTWCIDLSAHRHNTRISSKIPKNPMSLVIILETNFSSNCIDNWRRLCDPSLRQLYPHISDDKDTNSESIVLSIHLYYNHLKKSLKCSAYQNIYSLLNSSTKKKWMLNIIWIHSPFYFRIKDFTQNWKQESAVQ